MEKLSGIFKFRHEDFFIIITEKYFGGKKPPLLAKKYERCSYSEYLAI